VSRGDGCGVAVTVVARGGDGGGNRGADTRGAGGTSNTGI